MEGEEGNAVGLHRDGDKGTCARGLLSCLLSLTTIGTRSLSSVVFRSTFHSLPAVLNSRPISKLKMVSARLKTSL